MISHGMTQEGEASSSENLFSGNKNQFCQSSLEEQRKVKQTCDLTMLTRIKDRKILCVYIHVYGIVEIEDLVCIILYDTLII